MAAQQDAEQDIPAMEDLFGVDDMGGLDAVDQNNKFMDELNEMAGIGDEAEPGITEGDPAAAATPAPEDEQPMDLTALAGVEGQAVDGMEGLEGIDLNAINDERPGDMGEKADDAIDFEDISDDELPDEEDSEEVKNQNRLAAEDDAALDELFDIDRSSPPPATVPALQATEKEVQEAEGDDDLASEYDDDQDGDEADSPEQPFVDTEWLKQLKLLQGAKEPAPNEAVRRERAIEACKTLYPDFSPDKAPLWSLLFKPHLARYVGKTPLKPPKPIRPTKPHLDIYNDQKAAFNSAVHVDRGYWDKDDHLVAILEDEVQEESEDDIPDDFESEETLPGDVNMHDLEMICADFDTLSDVATSEAPVIIDEPPVDGMDLNDDLFGSDDEPPKKRLRGASPRAIISHIDYSLPSFDDPEKMVSKFAKKVVLDLNDPLLLMEEVDPAALSAEEKLAIPAKGGPELKEFLRKRFNLSNDAAYDLLKQNHQNKVRASLGNLTIEHALPALRLQYPYYRVKLAVPEARIYHRPRINFRLTVAFDPSQPKTIKRKSQRGKKAKELYPLTSDLSWDDNSTTTLVEYSEEYPVVLSQVGMGNRLLNYYRKNNKDDLFRPKPEVGEASVLLPEDKSPFSIFGHVDPGETVPTLYNTMFRSPIYEHKIDHEVHVLTKNRTSVDGSQFFMRKSDHAFVAGQQFPLVPVPGPHSRIVTTAAKNRLKMICYRLVRKKKYNRLNVGDVTRHFPGTSDMQNRQKMKEFMFYSKDHKEWEMKAGESIPTEEQMQQLIKPDDVCLLDSMQVGQQYLRDSGFGGEDDEDEDEKEETHQSIDHQLAPWRSTKNFLNASQGKAMLKIHGPGDPSGRDQGFSFLKTSMKGGFKAIGESTNSRLNEKKDLGGHSYNVARQQRAYEDSIRRVWDAQKAALSSSIPADNEMDDNVDGPDPGHQNTSFKRPSMSEAPTPSAFRGRDDETGTSFSKQSVGSQGRARAVTIVRVNKDGTEFNYTERDPTVTKLYMKRRNARLAPEQRFVRFLDQMSILTAHQVG